MSTTSPSEGDQTASGSTPQSPLASQRAKEEAKTTPAPAGGRAARFLQSFPLGYKDGFSQWWSNVSPAAAEHRVLSYVPYLQRTPTHTQTGATCHRTNGTTAAAPVTEESLHSASPVTTNEASDPHGPRRWRSTLVKLAGKDRALNELSVERMGEPVEDNLVMLHGYGAGLGFFYKNFEGLSRNHGWKLWALDMLGMGRSSRPPFVVRAKDPKAKITEAEDWFIDALEEWRVQRNLQRFTLLGHSLGGYLAVAYALKYPGRLNKLILASPVGIPEDPYAVNADMPDPQESTLGNEFLQDQADVVNQTNPNLPDADKTGHHHSRGASTTQKTTPPTAPRRPLPRWVTYLWDANISPFSLVRWSGPLGPRLVSGWTSRRFSQLGAEEAQALHLYSYTLFRQRGSGEYALSYILAPGAFARSPLIRRIQGVGRQMFEPPPSASSTTAAAGAATRASASASASEPALTPLAKMQRETGIPIVLMYGENDWMDVAGGYAAAHKIQEEKKRVLKNASEAEKRADHGEGKVVIVQSSGHHLYLDGWEEFNELVRAEMDDVTRRRKMHEAGLRQDAGS
ncbi:MAG: hypothetical protein M1826_006677 [Phylliscum demangeonii]|nr:MAG: hypothetical protein M1826_006677 [Phylliscum demangeonii]